MNYKTLITTFILFVTMVLGPIQLTQADGDHLEARRLLESGEILPLENILKHIKPSFPGKIIEIELERKNGYIVYELEILGEDGIVKEIFINAKTGELLPFKDDD